MASSDTEKIFKNNINNFIEGSYDHLRLAHVKKTDCRVDKQRPNTEGIT